MKINWLAVAVITMIVLFGVLTIQVTNALRDNAATINKVSCLSVAKLSHTPTKAEMRAVGCPVSLLPDSPPTVQVAP